FVPFTSTVEAQKSWQETYGKWQGKTGESASSSTSVSRLRFFGADEAFLVATTRTDPQPGSREALVYWRKGGYLVTLAMQAPLASNHADPEDAQNLMKAINWAAFGK